ncbi:MAG: MoaD/ThiS family protein [Candidatus Woesearchaeota archaeon]
MKVYIQKDRKKLNISYSGTVIGLLQKLNINSETVIVVKNGGLVNEDEIIKDSDEIEILQVVSGG